MDVVIRTAHGEAEITIARVGEVTALADIVERVTGSASPPTADIDGRPVLTTATIHDSGMTTGSIIDLGPPIRPTPQDTVLELVQVAGWGAGARQALGPGVYRVGPGRRINANDLEIAHVDKIAFEISIDSDGMAVVTAEEQAARIDGIGVEGPAPWATGILDVGGRAFELDRTIGRTAPPQRETIRAPAGTVVFNRPPRPARAPSQPPLAVSDGLDVMGEPVRPPRHDRRQRGGAPGSDQYVHAAFRAELMARRSAERERRYELFPHVAGAVRVAGTASTRLWSTRPDDVEAFEFAIGLGDIDWRPELSFGDDATGRPESVVGELGRLPIVPITVDLRTERGVAFVGSTEFTRAAVRGLLVEACVQHGPADLDVVVLSDPDRAPVWEWVKWLPHSRTSGVAQVLVALDQVDGWAASIRDGSPVAPRPDHLTLVVVDESAWWRDRAAPIRTVMSDASRPVRYVVLAEIANDVPNVCTTLVTEQPGDLARVEWLGERTMVDDVQLFLLGTPVAAVTARRLAPFDDPDLLVPTASTLPVSVPIPRLLGTANVAASTLAARWRATTERSHARVPLGVTRRGTVEIDLERDGPHTLIGGAPGTGKSEMLRTMVVGLAAGLPPGALTFALLDLAGQSTFAACASLPHVVMHHDVSDAHLAERALRSLRAELLGRDERAWRGVTLPRLVIVVDEPATVAMEHPQLVSSLLEIAADGERLGIHLIVATEHPSLLLDFDNAPEIGLRVALRLSDERESTALIGTGSATRVPRRTPGRGLIRVGDTEPAEFQAATVSASSSPGGGHDLELRPYVIGRELTPMELRVMRETNGNVGGTGSPRGVRNDLSRLVVEITAAAVAVEQARTRRLSPEPLPHVVDPRRLTTEHPGGGVPFALVDLPDQQRQQIRWWEPGVDGSLLIYGADGAGTSALLGSLAVGAAERFPADDLHLYVIDAGALAPLVALPHTGAVVRHDDVDRIARLVRLVGAEIDSRNSTSDEGRRRAVMSNRGSLIPHVVVMIDDVGALRNLLYDRSRRQRAGDDNSVPDDVWAGITRIVHDGPAVGICTVATAKRERDVPATFATQIPSRLVMRLAEPSAYASFGFRPVDIPRFVPGRALDPADGAELQIVQPPASLAGLIATLAADPARSRVPDPSAPETSRGTIAVTRRGDGIGLEVTTAVVRGVRLDPDEPGRVAAAAEAPISRFDDEAAVLDALVRVHGQLGHAARNRTTITRAAWFPVGSTMQRIDATGSTGPELNAMRHELADRTGITSTMLVEVEARRWMLVLRWDHLAAVRLERLLERAGFVDASVEPAPVAFGRVVGATTPVARRDASNGQSWAALYDGGVPIAATSVPQASREYPGIAIATEVVGLHRLDEVLGAPELADLVDEMTATAIAATGKTSVLDLRLVLADDPYPPFPAHDLRAPQRQAVALGAAAGAAGLAGRLRPVDVLSPTGAARVADVRRPWAIERVVELPPRVRLQRLPWWRRRGPLAQSRSRKLGRSPKTATAWRSGTKSRR